MHKIYFYIPYIIIFDVMAFFILKSNKDDSFQILLSLLIGVLTSFIYFVSQETIEKKVNQLIQSFFSGSQFEYLEKFTIPSVVLYRVRKNYDVQNDDVENSIQELSSFFKDYLNHTVQKNPIPFQSTLKSPLSYEIWSEFSKTNHIYDNFCKKAFGHYLPFDQKHTQDAENFYGKISPHLKSNHILA